jgi:large subunit ribosomal protein L1
MPLKRSKRYEAAAKLVEKNKSYAWPEAVKILKQIPATKGDQTIDLAFKLGIDPKQSDQMVRGTGTVALPAGSGKNVRVLVFAKGAAAEAAKAAGAEYIGFEDLIKKVTEGFQDFDVAVATPEAMADVRKLGRVLGPRGLNGRAVIEAVVRSRPATAKGRFIETCTLSSTFSPGIRIDLSPFLTA